MSAITLASDLIRRFEGLRTQAYWDPYGKVWTVGYGATGTGIQEGTVWTAQQAETDVQRRLGVLAGQLQQHILDWSNLSPTRQAAILDWTYNLGIGQLLGSTLYKKIQSGLLDDVPAELIKWTHAGGVVLPGLVARREEEVKLWEDLTYPRTIGVAISIS